MKGWTTQKGPYSGAVEEHEECSSFPEEKGAVEMCDDLLQPPFPVPLHHCGDGGTEIGSEIQKESRGSGKVF